MATRRSSLLSHNRDLFPALPNLQYRRQVRHCTRLLVFFFGFFFTFYYGSQINYNVDGENRSRPNEKLTCHRLDLYTEEKRKKRENITKSQWTNTAPTTHAKAYASLPCDPTPPKENQTSANRSYHSTKDTRIANDPAMATFTATFHHLAKKAGWKGHRNTSQPTFRRDGPISSLWSAS